MVVVLSTFLAEMWDDDAACCMVSNGCAIIPEKGTENRATMNLEARPTAVKSARYVLKASRAPARPNCNYADGRTFPSVHSQLVGTRMWAFPTSEWLKPGKPGHT